MSYSHESIIQIRVFPHDTNIQPRLNVDVKCKKIIKPEDMTKLSNVRHHMTRPNILCNAQFILTSLIFPYIPFSTYNPREDAFPLKIIVCVNVLTHRCHCILFIHIFIVKSCCEMYIYLHLRIMKIHCMSKCKGSHNITSGSFFLLSKHRIYYIFYLILSLFIYKIRHSRNCIKFNLFCQTLIISLIHTKSG